MRRSRWPRTGPSGVWGRVEGWTPGAKPWLSPPPLHPPYPAPPCPAPPDIGQLSAERVGGQDQSQGEGLRSLQMSSGEKADPADNAGGLDTECSILTRVP